MASRLWMGLGLVVIAVTSAEANAQQPPRPPQQNTPPSPPSPPSPLQPQAQGGAASSQQNGSPSADGKSAAPAAAARPMAGYSFGSGTSSLGQVRSVWRSSSHGPVASFPAFDEGDQGTSHLTVQLSAAVPFEQQAGPGFIVYRLKGARVLRSNDTNPLVSVHFNTPLVTAKLRNVGKDVEIRVELRAAVQPTAHIEAISPVVANPSDGSAAATAPAAPSTPSTPSTPSAPTTAPAKGRGHARGHKPVHAAKPSGPVATSQFVVDFPAGNYLDTSADLK